MKSAEVRKRFLEFFEERGHAVTPSSSLVPGNDPTLLFTNAGMVQFKKVFLGLEKGSGPRAVTSQKCVRAGGKHNDLEEVGRTTRHHTFFEMLGNFSFGDYFKREAIGYAWEFLTEVLGMDPDRIFVTVHHTDEEAAALWVEVAGVAPERVFRLGDKDNFWQMGDTGPCGPCSELHYDLRPEAEWGTIPSSEEFERRGEAGEFLELWNLVFMQFDRDGEGTLNPLPAPSIDTGAGLERIAAVLQGVDSNYDTDVFLPLLNRVGEVVGEPYSRGAEEGVSYRVIADHARAVAFLLADGVFPSNEGRGYVLRRILRRGVRHAWLLGRREATLVHVVEKVIEEMAEAYPELEDRREHLLTTTRAEEDRFLATIEGGLSRFAELAPQLPDGAPHGGTISGAEAFKLYDTFGFPFDLTQLMAEERGYQVDEVGFTTALNEQRDRSRADRVASSLEVQGDLSLKGWTVVEEDAAQVFVGYGALDVETTVTAFGAAEGRTGIVLRENPFYLESGGQVSDTGRVEGEGWVLTVEGVQVVDGLTALLGSLEGELPRGGAIPAVAMVDAEARRSTQRNHTATHLLHAALRRVLGDHVVQRGSLVEPGRLRFDFAHTAPVSDEERAQIEGMVNERVWENHPVTIEERSYEEAVQTGAMALFGEKYGDVVRVVDIPEVSTELCGGTHVGGTGDIGSFRLVSESGVAAGVRRIEAVTGAGAFRYFQQMEAELASAATELGTPVDNVVGRLRQLLDETRELNALLKELRSSGGVGETIVRQAEVPLGEGESASYLGLRLRARNADDARDWGDRFLSEVTSGVAVVSADMPGEKHTLFAFVTDDLIQKGVRADALVREVATHVSGRGGGRPHMAQAGVQDPAGIDAALQAGEAVVGRLFENGGR